MFWLIHDHHQGVLFKAFLKVKVICGPSLVYIVVAPLVVCDQRSHTQHTTRYTKDGQQITFTFKKALNRTP
jgi:hypothetical protein